MTFAEKDGHARTARDSRVPVCMRGFLRCYCVMAMDVCVRFEAIVSKKVSISIFMMSHGIGVHNGEKCLLEERKAVRSSFIPILSATPQSVNIVLERNHVLWKKQVHFSRSGRREARIIREARIRNTQMICR